ncbi:MAG TPA: PRC-barrel domain-containing protein [Burkholderiales bacterium]|nr:PRC-barrel domain-containing protein [Burkholderiales bacterium]
MANRIPTNNEPRPSPEITSTGSRVVGAGAARPHEGPGPRIMAADTLEGNDVRNPADEDLGTIEHIMLDVPNGRIAYAVLSFGGFLRMGEKLFAVPWRALTLDTDKHCFVLNASKELLEKAPGFDKDHWPSMADETWAASIHDYYGVPLYWH